MLDYVWPAVDAFLWVGLPEDLVTVLQAVVECVCVGARTRACACK